MRVFPWVFWALFQWVSVSEAETEIRTDKNTDLTLFKKNILDVATFTCWRELSGKYDDRGEEGYTTFGDASRP